MRTCRLCICLQLVLLMCASGASAAALHAQAKSEEAVTDGGGTPDVLESIFVPALPDAPFSMTLATEWTRLMNNGGTFVSVNRRELKRDSSGRIYQERWLLVPKGSNIRSEMNRIQIADPTTATLTQCNVGQHVCELLTWRMPSTLRYQPGPTASAPLTNGKGFQTHEDLGESETMGLPVHLYRDTTTFNPGALGNNKPMVATREFSYSAALGINLRSVLDNPMVGRQQFVVTAITTSEPDGHFFLPPEGYRVIDHRGPPAER